MSERRDDPGHSAGVFVSGYLECVGAGGPGQRVLPEPHARSRARRCSAVLSISMAAVARAQSSSCDPGRRPAAHSIVAARSSELTAPDRSRRGACLAGGGAERTITGGRGGGVVPGSRFARTAANPFGWVTAA